MCTDLPRQLPWEGRPADVSRDVETKKNNYPPSVNKKEINTRMSNCPPLRFFETTPLGSILNRFSSDCNTIDQVRGDVCPQSKEKPGPQELLLSDAGFPRSADQSLGLGI